ncbi:MAG: hypothetical protein AAFR79_20575 [Pseudomonadota bacterium]
MKPILSAALAVGLLAGCAKDGELPNPSPIVSAIADTAAQIGLRETLKPACSEFYAQVRLNAETAWPEGFEGFLNETEDQGFAICRKLIPSGQEILATDPLDVVQISESLEETRKAIRAGLI